MLIALDPRQAHEMVAVAREPFGRQPARHP